MPRPGLFDVLTLGVFWRMDQRQEEQIERRRVESRQLSQRDEELALKRREVAALERLAAKEGKQK